MEIRCEKNVWIIELNDCERKLTFSQDGNVYYAKAIFMDKMSEYFENAIKNKLKYIEKIV